MKRSFFILSLILLSAIAYGQTTKTDGIELSRQSNGKYQVHMVDVSAKKATSLLCDKVPSRKDSEIDVNGQIVAIKYDSTTKTYTVNGNNVGNTKEMRKAVRGVVRSILGIE